MNRAEEHKTYRRLSEALNSTACRRTPDRFHPGLRNPGYRRSGWLRDRRTAWNRWMGRIGPMRPEGPTWVRGCDQLETDATLGSDLKFGAWYTAQFEQPDQGFFDQVIRTG